MCVRSLTSKAVIVTDLITDHNLDVIGLTETWLKPDCHVRRSEKTKAQRELNT